jgi:hypothetical protein
MNSAPLFPQSNLEGSLPVELLQVRLGLSRSSDFALETRQLPWGTLTGTVPWTAPWQTILSRPFTF